MFQQTLSLSALLLIIWLIYLDNQQASQIASLQHQLTAQTQQYNQAQTIISEQLEAISVFVEQQNNAEKQAQLALAQIDQQKQMTNLYKTYVNVLTAEQMQQAGQLNEAAALIKAQKEAIWMAGDRYPAHKDSLQGLMQPIDEGSQQWQNGNAEHQLDIVSNTLRDVIGKITEGK
jgi:hypothetical protein